MSSSAEILERLCKTCNGNHRHVHLVSGRAKAAQVYPRLFCSKLCEGIAAHKKLDDLGMMSRPVMSMEVMRATAKSDSGEDPRQALHERYGSDIEAFDDLTGDVLDPAMMAEARREEIGYFKKMGVHEKVDIQEYFKATGKAPIAVCWVGVNKGDSRTPNNRSRLVAE